MFADRDPNHYLRALRTTSVPQRLAWLDCATRTDNERGLFVDRWNLGALGTTHWTAKKHERKDTMGVHHNPAELWRRADEYCTSGRRVVMFAHDLAYQLRVSQALIHLPAMGWTLDKIVLERQASWALLRNDDRTLMCCDLRSWAPVELQTIMSDLSGFGVRLVADIQGRADDELRALRNAAAIRDAVLQICEWIEAENLGPFRPTGSGQSYSAYRRRFMHHKLLVHDDADRLGVERAAMWTGRCEAWRHGPLTDGPYVEYDMQAAYCRIANECEVPVLAAWASSTPTASTVERAMESYSVLADVTVTLDVPVLPTRRGGRTLWPVGTFRTHIWDPEIRLAMMYATDIRFHRIWRYRRAPALQDFAGWVLDNMGAQTQVYGPIPQRVLKHWSRCLVGRLGLRYRTWEKFGYQDDADLRLLTYIDTDAKTATDMLVAGNEMMILSDMNESKESLPQVPGWVMSECRARLWRAMIRIGLDNVVYVDTDSMIVYDAGSRKTANYIPPQKGEGWAQKGRYSRLTINGPRNYTAESTRRVSGLPLTARQTAPLEFSGQIMRSIKESMRAGELDCVTSIPRKFVLDAPDLRRQHVSKGLTLPFVVESTSQQED